MKMKFPMAESVSMLGKGHGRNEERSCQCEATNRHRRELGVSRGIVQKVKDIAGTHDEAAWNSVAFRETMSHSKSRDSPGEFGQIGAEATNFVSQTEQMARNAFSCPLSAFLLQMTF
ncbi:MAG: hypothetical protein OXF56_08445 [Rhodobacteraceae bacterium]|nr:hypothetical protein [Paracoccaceae bacterium]